MNNRREWTVPPLPSIDKPKLELPKMEDGHMYRVFGDKVIEVIRHGEELVRIDDPRVQEIPGQEVLDI